MSSKFKFPHKSARELLEEVKKLRWLPARHWFDLRQVMRLSATIRDPADGEHYRFICSSLPSYQRAKELLNKEPDTSSS